MSAVIHPQKGWYFAGQSASLHRNTAKIPFTIKEKKKIMKIFNWGYSNDRVTITVKNPIAIRCLIRVIALAL